MALGGRNQSLLSRFACAKCFLRYFQYKQTTAEKNQNQKTAHDHTEKPLEEVKTEPKRIGDNENSLSDYEYLPHKHQGKPSPLVESASDSEFDENEEPFVPGPGETWMEPI